MLRVRGSSRQARLSPGCSWFVLVTPSEARGGTPFLPLCGRSPALDEGKDSPGAHSDKSLLARRREPGEDQEVRLRRSAEAESLRKTGAPENTSAAVGGELSRSRIGYRKGGGKSSADGLQVRLRAARSPLLTTEGAARRPSCDASFAEARGADRYSRRSGKKSAQTNSQN